MINPKTYLLIWLSCFSGSLWAQPQHITLDSCYSWARQHYPMSKQLQLIDKSKDYSIENANKGYLPGFQIYGQASYQSEVTQLPIVIPNLPIDPLSRDQYRLYGELTQPLTDLFTVGEQKKAITAAAQVETQKAEVELFKLRERINQLYFGILLLDAQLQQTDLLKKDLQSGIEKTEVGIKNGIGLKSAADNLRAELLKTNQRTIELQAMKQAYSAMLSLLINKPISESTIISKPSSTNPSSQNNRPEILLFALQKKSIDQQIKLVDIKNLPRFSLYFQGGLGRPALNMLSNEFTGYYIAGIRLNWNLTSFYTSSQDKKILRLNQKIVDVQQELFSFNSQMTYNQHNAEHQKYLDLIQTDKEIIGLRESHKMVMKNQLENGTSTANDYMLAVHAQDQAALNLILHQIQLLLTQYSLLNTYGN